MISRAFLSLFIGVFFIQYLPAEEQLWYNAAGEVVKVTQVDKTTQSKKKAILSQGKESYTSSALYALHGGAERKVQRFRTGYSYRPQYYRPVWSSQQPYYYRNSSFSRSSSRSSFQGHYRRSYKSSGWSVKLKL